MYKKTSNTLSLTWANCYIRWIKIFIFPSFILWYASFVFLIYVIFLLSEKLFKKHLFQDLPAGKRPLAFSSLFLSLSPLLSLLFFLFVYWEPRCLPLNHWAWNSLVFVFFLCSLGSFFCLFCFFEGITMKFSLALDSLCDPG